MKTSVRAVISVALLMSLRWTTAQTPPSSAGPCPMHAAHMGSDGHHSIVEAHGDQAMGFAHDKTTHHFHLSQSGGTIEVKVNDEKDSTNVEAIRMHLAHIAKLFSEGDFSTPMFVHDSIPPGVTTMSLLKEKIRFEYQAIDEGGRVKIVSEDSVARAAIHDFLRFQITDHGTGDALDIDAAK